MRKLHWYYKFLIIFIIFFSMFFLLSKNMSNIINSTPYKNYINFISVPFDFINKYNIFKYKSVLEKNEELSKRMIVITNEKEELESLRKEVEDLKELVQIEKTFIEYETIYAQVISRNKMYWFNTVILNKGSKSGISENSIVVTDKGLLGIVTGVTKDYSTVKLITNSENNKISVGIKTNESFKYGTIIGYDYPFIKVELTSSDKDIKLGDSLVTSGLGNLPKNIKIGKIEKQEKDSYGVSNILYVKPYQDMEDINYVAVLVR